MLRHEVAHIKQRHTFDVLLIELLSIVFWCSPLVYCYKKSLRAVHEYLADDAATQTHSKQEYGSMLIRQLQSGMQPTIANSFISSQIKQRFAMMLKSSSPRAAYLKYSVCAPLIFILSVLLHQESLKAQEVFTDENGYKITKYTDFNIVESMDTIVTFDPATFKESIAFVKNIDSVYQKLDNPAEFIGGQVELMKYLGSAVQYPKEAREKKQEGRPIIQFIVTKNGWIDAVKIKKSSGYPLLDEEAKRIVLSMNDAFYTTTENGCRITKSHWKPGAMNGKSTSCYFNLPLSFKLEK
jgi:TonB family protein